MVAPLCFRFVKNARNVRCFRAFFSIREGYGVIMARRWYGSAFFYGSLQTIHLIYFRGGADGAGTVRVRFAGEGGRVGRRVQSGAVGGCAACHVPAVCRGADVGAWMVCRGGVTPVRRMKKHPQRLVLTGVFLD